MNVDTNQIGTVALQLEVLRQLIFDFGFRIDGDGVWNVSMLDLCCGEMTAMRNVQCTGHRMSVDVQDCPARPRRFTFMRSDAEDYLDIVHSKDCDIVLCLDRIEHFTKEKGWRVIRKMESVGRLSVIFTPFGDYLITPEDPHPDKHHSGWLPSEFESIGWNTLVFPNWHPTLGVGAFFAWKFSA